MPEPESSGTPGSSHDTDPLHGGGVRRPDVLLGDLTSGLLWPHLLRAIPLSLRPERVFLGLLAWVAVLMIGNLNTFWGGEDARAWVELLLEAELRAWSGIAAGVLDLNLPLVFSSLAWYWNEITGLVREHPWAAAALTPPIMVLWIIFGGAISRSAAVEFSLSRTQGPRESFIFAFRKWPSLLGATLAPGLVAGVIVLLLGVAGLVFAVPVVHLVGGALYPVLLVLGLIAFAILTLWCLGWPLLVPGVACEGTDAIDSIQRAFAYICSRPLRFLLYGAALAVQGVLLVSLAAYAIGGVNELTATSLSRFLGETPSAIFEPEPEPGQADAYFRDAENAGGEGDPDAPIATHAWTRDLVGFWSGAFALLVGAIATSFFFTASTLLYLLMRRLCDGQDVAELWSPSA